MTPTRPRALIGLSGKQYAGKDQVADLLAQALPGFEKIPIARAIKEAYARQHGLSLEDIERHKAQHRPGLIALGDWGRSQDANYWLGRILSPENPHPNVIVSDVRLKREYEALKAAGAFLIRVEADRDLRAQRGNIVSESDPTECELDTVTGWDAVISNNGTREDLLDKVQTLVSQIRTHFGG